MYCRGRCDAVFGLQKNRLMEEKIIIVWIHADVSVSEHQEKHLSELKLLQVFSHFSLDLPA